MDEVVHHCSGEVCSHSNEDKICHCCFTAIYAHWEVTESHDCYTHEKGVRAHYTTCLEPGDISPRKVT